MQKSFQEKREANTETHTNTFTGKNADKPPPLGNRVTKNVPMINSTDDLSNKLNT